MKQLLLLFFIFSLAACGTVQNNQNEEGDKDFPKELISFKPYEKNPVFTAATGNAWDQSIRERGYILFEDSVYKLWYTGFTQHDSAVMHLGYATSRDGINWERYAGNPVYSQRWTEDMHVLRHDGLYHMYAEGTDDVAHYMTSKDGITWEDQGDLIMLKTNGDTIPGPYGTPVLHIEGGKWYLFYERLDEGIWLATSTDGITWKNVQDEPVLKPGPEKFDLGAVAADQIITHNNRYYMFYHANADPMWTTKPTPWSSNIAVSDDLINWKKYSGNPITSGDHSSPVVVFDGKKYRLYTMHPDGWLWENE